LPTGPYQVNLHFAEIHGGVVERGQRDFSVQIEGGSERKIQPETKKARVEPFKNVQVRDGCLDIQFIRGIKDLPKISAIEIESLK